MGLTAVALGTLGTALSLTLLGVTHRSSLALRLARSPDSPGLPVLATLNVSVQVSLPDWVRGACGLAMFVTVFFGAMTAGSALWGNACFGARFTRSAFYRGRRRSGWDCTDLAL